MGLNFRMTDIQAAIARVQLKKLDSYVEHRNKVASIYKDEFKNINGISVQEFGNDYKSNYFFFGILVDENKRDELVNKLIERGVMVKTWTSVHAQPLWNHQFIKSPEYFNNAENISNSVILLPIHNTITEQEVEYVIKNVKELI